MKCNFHIVLIYGIKYLYNIQGPDELLDTLRQLTST